MSTKFYIRGLKAYIDEQVVKILEQYSDIEREIMYGDEFSLSEYFSFLTSPSIFSEAKAVIVYNADSINSKSGSGKSNEAIKQFFELISKASNSEVYQFITSEEENASLEKQFKAAGFEMFLQTKLNRHTVTYELDREFKKRFNVSIPYDEARQLYDETDQNFSIILKELDVVELYLGTEKVTSYQDVLSKMSFFKTKSLNFIVDAVLQQERNDALNHLKNYTYSTKQDMSQQLFSTIVSTIQSLYRMHANLERSNMPDFIEKKYKAALPKWSSEQFIYFFELASDINFGMVTGKVELSNGVLTLISAIPFSKKFNVL